MSIRPVWPNEITIRGYFTKEIWLRNQKLDEIAKRLGFEEERLGTGGAAVYRLLQLPGEDDFEFAGYTHWSGGKPKTPGASALDGGDIKALKRGLRDTWTLQGGYRLVKLVPTIPHNDKSIYPPGHGVHQWRISESAAERGNIKGELTGEIAPGGRYEPKK